MSARVYLMADTGDGRPLSFGTCTKAPERARGNRFSLSFKGDAIYGTNRQRKTARDARRWWLVEAESAAHARALIANNGGPVHVPGPMVGHVAIPAGRILDSGGAA